MCSRTQCSNKGFSGFFGVRKGNGQGMGGGGDTKRLVCSEQRERVNHRSKVIGLVYKESLSEILNRRQEQKLEHKHCTQTNIRIYKYIRMLVFI